MKEHMGTDSELRFAVARLRGQRDALIDCIALLKTLLDWDERGEKISRQLLLETHDAIKGRKLRTSLALTKLGVNQ